MLIPTIPDGIVVVDSFCVPNTALSDGYQLCHVLSLFVAWGEVTPHFVNEQTEAGEVQNLP